MHSPNDASEFTKRANREFEDGANLDYPDETDFEFATRGLIARLDDTAIRNDEGDAVWDLGPYSFLEDGSAPPTVNSSLWRQSRLNLIHGLFKVTDRVYQVRGYDLSVISFIEGDTGWIVIDPLVSTQTARAARDLAFEHLGRKPVHAVIYTHSHVDHFGGVKGVISEEDVEAGNTRVIAPEGFMKAAISENLIAGNAMGRRAAYQYGSLLPRGPRGHVDIGLGKAVSTGTITLIPPTDSIAETGTEMTIDGVKIVFQVTPGTEAPAEMNFFFPGFASLCMAENCSHNMHNLLTLRGAQVRDPLAWAYYIDEAINLFAGDSRLVFTSHHWPVWGRDRLIDYMKKQRDMYKYLHDQTVRMLNKGYTGIEIAETLELPPELAGEWYNRGYYGSISHNVKAIYQRYLGWYDGNPANLHPLPPVEAARKYVEYMGGAEEVLKKARRAYENGEYRWVTQVVNHVVFSDPDNTEARELEADALEQMGYQSENATWRNAFLTGARELRDGVVKAAAAGPSTSGTDMIASLSLDMLFDYMSVHLDGPKAQGKRIAIELDMTDTGEKYVLLLENSVLNYSSGGPAGDVDAALRLSRALLNRIIQGEGDLKSAFASGEIEVEGDAGKLGELFSLMERPDFWFNIVTP